MNYRNMFNPENAAEGFLSRMISRFTGGLVINIIITLFVLGILAITFIYVGLVFLKNL